MTTTTPVNPPGEFELTHKRLYMMRAGYLFMGLGLAIVKWPLLLDVASVPLHEGVITCMLTAMSLLALLGVRYPVKMLPVLVFESAWKLLWLGLVALPMAMDGELDPASSELLVKNSLVVVIIAVTPWRFVWQSYVRAPGEGWSR